MTEQWLPITEYSTKYKVSVSTLRRRIKSEDIKYRFVEGKYLLLDEPVTTHPLHRPSLSDFSEAGENQAALSGTTQPVAPAPQPASLNMTAAPTMANNPEFNLQPKKEVQPEHLDGPILSAANRLLTELKKAYAQILQEKEEQILQLREEVTDLKTLVRVLEGENDKLSARYSPEPRRDLEF